MPEVTRDLDKYKTKRELFIHSKKEFIELKKKLGVRLDWHEPDEQAVDVDMKGYKRSFDNAMGDDSEAHIIFLQDGWPVAAVNVATFCAWASGLEE